MQPNKQVTAILLNYNGYEDTIACYESLMNVTYPSLNIVIVDNLSPDNSFDKLKAYFLSHQIEHHCFNSVEEAMKYTNATLPSVSLIQAGSNNGYGHGNNIGIRFALKIKTDYVLILNNDTIVKADFLEPLVDACEKDHTIGIASGKIFYYDRPDTLWYAGGKLHPLTAKVEHFHIGEKDTGQTIPEPVTFITGCLWLIPSRVFEKVGLINEDYFMYVEDVEYCYRVLKKGLSLSLCEKSKIFHKVSSSTGGHNSEFSVFWSAKNMIRLIKDNFRGGHKILALSYHLFVMPAKWIYRKEFRLVITQIKGSLHGLVDQL